MPSSTPMPPMCWELASTKPAKGTGFSGSNMAFLASKAEGGGSAQRCVASCWSLLLGVDRAGVALAVKLALALPLALDLALALAQGPPLALPPLALPPLALRRCRGIAWCVWRPAFSSTSETEGVFRAGPKGP